MIKIMIVAVYLFVLSFFDWKEKAVPQLLLWLGGMAAVGMLTYGYYERDMQWQIYFAESLSAVIPGMCLLIAAFFTKKAGMADGIVFLILGVFLGRQESMTVFWISLLMAAVFSGYLLLFCKKGKNYQVPYLPFVTASYLLSLTL